MIDKYTTIIIYEIDNGWVFKIEEPTDPKKPNQISYESKYCKDLKEIIDELKKAKIK